MATPVDDVRRAAARLRGRVLRTPLRRSEWLSGARGADVHLKLEVVQPTSSYKIRGAFNAALRLREHSATDTPRLVTASAGNHGRALAFAARELALPLTVFIAADAPRAKIDAIRAAGAELRECRDYDEAEREAKRHAASGAGLFISPYWHPDVIAGAGTIGLELLEDLPAIDAVVVPVGGGGLISGIGRVMKALSPHTRVVGVEVAASCPFTKSLAAGRIVPIDVGPSLADGLTGNLDPDTTTFDIVREVVDEIVVVEEAHVRRAVADVVTNEHLVAEGAAAVGPAAILSGQLNVKGTVAVILTGANIDADRLCSVLRP
jgi:threonine dehydratase